MGNWLSVDWQTLLRTMSDGGGQPAQRGFEPATQRLDRTAERTSSMQSVDPARCQIPSSSKAYASTLTQFYLNHHQESIVQSFDQFLSVLQCPACSGDFSFERVGSVSKAGIYGILNCTCSEYPVIDDIPVLMKSRVGILSHWNDGAVHLGPTAEHLVAGLRRGATVDLLVDCMAFPRKYPLQWRLSQAGVWPGSLSDRVGLVQTRYQLRRLLSHSPGEVLAQDLFSFFYSRRSGNNTYLSEYFLNRFVMPRYLSAMSLIQRLEESDQPVLDIACGYGHFEHYLTRRRRSTSAIGVDFNFFQVWGARKFVAPDANFLCCDVSLPLPLKSGSCSGTICSDSFMLMPNKPLLVQEVERVAPERPAIYARVGNREVGPPNPRHGGEMTPEGYWDLFGRSQSRYFADDALWKDYLMRRDPRDRNPPELLDTRWEKYLSYVTHPEALSNHGEEDGVWPHAVGELTLNPVLTVVGDQPDALLTELIFGSAWGAYEDSDMMSYTERWGRIEKETLRRALSEPGGEAASKLIASFALVGVPDHYVRDRLGRYRPDSVVRSGSPP